MSNNMDKCPYCSTNIMKGAMKCPGCGKLLTTAEQQQQNIVRHKEASQKTDVVGLIVKFIIGAAIVVGVVKNYDKIMEIIKGL